MMTNERINANSSGPIHRTISEASLSSKPSKAHSRNRLAPCQPICSCLSAAGGCPAFAATASREPPPCMLGPSSFAGASPAANLLSAVPPRIKSTGPTVRPSFFSCSSRSDSLSPRPPAISPSPSPFWLPSTAASTVSSGLLQAAARRASIGDQPAGRHRTARRPAGPFTRDFLSQTRLMNYFL